MRRNCNLELQLLPPYLSPSDADSDHRETEKRNYGSPETAHQPLTIFYDGKICVCDVTDFQARAILLLASREMEEGVKTPTAGSGQCSPILRSPAPYSPTAALSMKRSLQRFLQKRKHRAQAMSPYHR